MEMISTSQTHHHHYLPLLLTIFDVLAPCEMYVFE